MDKAKPPEQRKRGEKRAKEIDALMHYLQPGIGLGMNIRQQLQELPSKYFVLLIAPRKQYSVLAQQLIGYFARGGTGGIYVTTNKSAADLIEGMGKGEGGSELFLIDAVSGKSGCQESGKRTVLYIESPGNLTELDSAINEAVEKLAAGQHFFVLDSLSTLLVYNSERSVEKFVHSLGGKLRAKQFQSVLTLASKTKHETVNVFAQSCDKTIEL